MSTSTYAFIVLSASTLILWCAVLLCIRAEPRVLPQNSDGCADCTLPSNDCICPAVDAFFKDTKGIPRRAA